MSDAWTARCLKVCASRPSLSGGQVRWEHSQRRFRRRTHCAHRRLAQVLLEHVNFNICHRATRRGPAGTQGRPSHLAMRHFPSRRSWPSAAGGKPGAVPSVCDGDDPDAKGGVPLSLLAPQCLEAVAATPSPLASNAQPAIVACGESRAAAAPRQARRHAPCRPSGPVERLEAPATTSPRAEARRASWAVRRLWIHPSSRENAVTEELNRDLA